MRKQIEQYIEELVLEIKEDDSPVYEIFSKNTDVVSCNFVLFLVLRLLKWYIKRLIQKLVLKY